MHFSSIENTDDWFESVSEFEEDLQWLVTLPHNKYASKHIILQIILMQSLDSGLNWCSTLAPEVRWSPTFKEPQEATTKNSPCWLQYRKKS